ncbi:MULTISPECIES: hypothetical protein [Streptomyces]|uniref:hypothetical protein n=1 Tax=Streptomyces TaxID=1883 RepID=UPI000A76C344|nr:MULTISPECIES: hypothetical protein [Streptomyces]
MPSVGADQSDADRGPGILRGPWDGQPPCGAPGGAVRAPRPASGAWPGRPGL